MAENPESPASENNIRAANAVFSLLPQIAGFIVGFSGLAYAAGWREVSSYYRELGVPWALQLLNSSQIIQTGVWLIIIISLFSFFSILFLVLGNISQKGLRLWAIIFLGLAAITNISAVVLDTRISNTGIIPLAIGTSFFWAASAGLTIGELIACLALDRLKWGGYHIFLLYFIISLGLLHAPENMGYARARMAGDLESSALPRITLTPTNSADEWRLIGPCGDKFLLVLLSKERNDRRFKLVQPDAIDEIYGHERK